jgi:hypothetical protein
MADEDGGPEPTAEFDLTKTSPFVAKDFPVGGSDSDGDDNPLGRLQERLEDARDAIVESEIFERIYEVGCRVSDASSVAWSFTKSASWILGTSALVLIVPLLYEMDKELNMNGMQDGIPDHIADNAHADVSGSE